MKLGWAKRTGGLVAVVLALSGCVDVKLDVAVKDGDKVTGTMVQVMDADTYTMVKAGTTGHKGGRSFCMETGAVLARTGDGGATCTIVRDGTWSDLSFNGDRHQQTVSIAPDGDGLVRVAFPVSEMVNALANKKQLDEQARSMLVAMFQGHTLTLTVSGGTVVETNMDVEAGSRSAEKKIDFLDLLNGAATLPQEYYAVVRVK
jgi:hypothetical protein